MLDFAPPVKKFIFVSLGQSPIVALSGVSVVTTKCECGRPGRFNIAQGGVFLDDIPNLRAMFEKAGTHISMTKKDVLAGARIKEIGDMVIEWCRNAEVGDIADIREIFCTITRVADDTAAVVNLELKAAPPAMRLVGVG